MSNLYVGSSNSSRVRNLTDYTGVIDDSATVTVELRDSSGDLVAGEAWPKVMPSLGSGGNYQVFFSNTIGIIAGETYKETIIATNAADTTKITKFTNYRLAAENAGC
jgi:hypothetical protein